MICGAFAAPQVTTANPDRPPRRASLSKRST